MTRRTLSLSAAIATAALAMASLASTEAATTAPRSGKDPMGVATKLFEFKDARIKESSGLETATNFRKIVYTHNDSGDTSRFFAVDYKGNTRAVYNLPGAGHHDWEDMSAGPNKTLWFGDIGSNASRRGYITVYRVKEPKRLKSRNLSWKGYDFKYGDGENHNAESLLVNPRNGVLMIVSKQKSGAAFYRAKPPFSTRRINTLKKVGPAPGPGVITAGSYAPNGKHFVIRSYGRAYFYKRVHSTPYVMGVPNGGESLAYARYKSGIIVGQEGVGSPVYRVTRP